MNKNKDVKFINNLKQKLVFKIKENNNNNDI